MNLNQLQSVFSDLWSKILSVYQTTPWVFWLIGGLIALFIVYITTLPRRRRAYLRKNYQFYTRHRNEGDWRFASIPFPGQIHYHRLGKSVIGFTYNGEDRDMTDIQTTLPRNDNPAGIGAWHRDWSDTEGVDWLVVKTQQPQRQLPRWPFVLAGLILLAIFCWFVARPAFNTWSESRQQSAETVEALIPPTMPAPLRCNEDGTCTEQGATDPTPEPEEESLKNEVEFEESTLVIDLSEPASRTPSAIEEKLNDWLSSLPTGPSVDIPIPDWLVDLFVRDNATIISLGDDGFVVVSSWNGGLDYRLTNESLNQVGDKISVYGNCGTIVAGEDEGQLRWGVCFKDDWQISKYAKGGYDVVVYDGGLVVDTKGFYPRWTPLWLLTLLPLIGLLVFWLRRR